MEKESIWRNYGPEVREAFERIRAARLEEGLVMKVETLDVSDDGAILLNPNNPEHRAWYEDDMDEDLESRP